VPGAGVEPAQAYAREILCISDILFKEFSARSCYELTTSSFALTNFNTNY